MNQASGAVAYDYVRRRMLVENEDGEWVEVRKEALAAIAFMAIPRTHTHRLTRTNDKEDRHDDTR